MTDPFKPHHAREHAALSPIEEKSVEALKAIFDPEIPINIYDLGLIYDIDVSPENRVKLTVTLTSPNCPEAESLPGDMQRAVEAVEGVSGVDVDLVWEPPFTVEMMSDAARLQLNL
jgi:FeS assembly SUF system protein